MLDIKWVIANKTAVVNDLAKRGKQDRLWILDEVIEDYNSFRQLKSEVDDLRRERNQISQKINEAKKEKKSIDSILKRAKELPEKILLSEEKMQLLEQQLNEKLRKLPNMTHSSVPAGNDEAQNQVLHAFGKKTKFSFKPKGHMELFEALDQVDLARAAKIAGARCYYLKNELVLLEQALINFALDYLVKKGFTLIRPPTFITKEAMEGAAELPDFKETLYQTDTNHFLIATAEHALASMHMDEIFSAEDLPRKYAGISSCYRKEVGAHGKDTKGVFRVHEFLKVEQFIYSKPEDSWKLHEELLKNAEEIMQELNLPYRVIVIAAGVLNDTAAKKCDIEGWFPAQETYRELVSCSNCTDYQARKLAVRYKPKPNTETEFVHTLNATALATPRILVAIAENYQQADGSIKVPDALVKYTGFKYIRKLPER